MHYKKTTATFYLILMAVVRGTSPHFCCLTLANWNNPCVHYIRVLSYRARRKPRLLLALPGELLLRLATRQLVALLFQLPPRFTRLEPCHGFTILTITSHQHSFLDAFGINFIYKCQYRHKAHPHFTLSYFTLIVFVIQVFKMSFISCHTL